VTEDARPWALRVCVDPSGLLVGGWLYDHVMIWMFGVVFVAGCLLRNAWNFVMPMSSW